MLLYRTSALAVQQALILLGISFVFLSFVETGVIRNHEFEKWTNGKGDKSAPAPPKYKMLRYAKKVVNEPENRKMSCIFCTFAVDGVQALIAQNSTDDEVAEFLVNLCDLFDVEQPHVCKNIIYAFKDEVVFVLERSVFTPEEICGAFIANCGHSDKPLTHMWNITIPGGKPPIRPWPKILDNKPTYKVLHLSDIHIDHQYVVGTEAYCQLDSALGTYAMCCRDYSQDSVGNPTNLKDKPIYVPAGPWGMPYLCDLPYQTFDSAMRHISKTFKDLDYIIITGDFEAHDSWDYTEDLTRENMNNMTNVFLEYFPNVPVYVSIGNHEGVPQDAMAPHTMPEYDTRGPQWLYKIMSDMWAHWIPKEALDTVQYRASYAVYPKPGLKLISLNTIYCSEFNFYLYVNEVDPDATLEWLIEELVDSEKKGELVHIISHIPPGDNYCLKGWSWNFFEIVKRFENTIAQMFYGHTHYDQFMVYYDMDDPNRRPFHFNWISPSLTTYDFLNPAYRIYEIDGGYDGATYTVKEAKTYFANVTEANMKNKEPEWVMSYDTKEHYQMTDFSPQSWSDLSDKLWTNTTMFRDYVKNFYRNHYNNECYTDYKCRYVFVCDIKKGRSYDESFCDHLTR
uniref:Sphingomyelin phosphodiesterase n=1 Tax=Caenorhabditis tropicalis TaxID=1561998 RepID=A0A1I7T0R0_9PELO